MGELGAVVGAAEEEGPSGGGDAAGDALAGLEAGGGDEVLGDALGGLDGEDVLFGVEEHDGGAVCAGDFDGGGDDEFQQAGEVEVGDECMAELTPGGELGVLFLEGALFGGELLDEAAVLGPVAGEALADVGDYEEHHDEEEAGGDVAAEDHGEGSDDFGDGADGIAGGSDEEEADGEEEDDEKGEEPESLVAELDVFDGVGVGAGAAAFGAGEKAAEV